MKSQIDVEGIKKHLEKKELKDAISVQSNIRTILSEFFKQRGYLEIPPVIISPLTDPLNHPAEDSYINYYGMPYILTKSMIFHKQIAVQYLNQIFAFSPNVRLETVDKNKTGRHLSEFTQFDLEKKHGTRAEMINIVEDFFVYLSEKINVLNSEELSRFNRTLKIPQRPFKQIKFTDAVNVYGSDFEAKLSSEMEEPFWIIDIPLQFREFYDREDALNPEILVDMDLIYPEGFGEALSGGEREYDYEKIKERILKKGQDEKTFEWYLNFAKQGLEPSAGFGIGIERLTRYICGLKRIEDTHPFPKQPGVISL
ncbi:MAG: asparagine synthetase A [Thermoplasmata archaeon]